MMDLWWKMSEKTQCLVCGPTHVRLTCTPTAIFPNMSLNVLLSVTKRDLVLSWMDGTQCGVFRLELITCTSWKVVLVLMFYFLCLFLWESKGYKLICGSDRIGMIMKWAMMAIGTLVMCAQTFLWGREEPVWLPLIFHVYVLNTDNKLLAHT